MNRFTWDLRYDALRQRPRPGAMGRHPRGPLAIPGTYTARLDDRGQAVLRPLEVKPDPRVPATPADLREAV